MSLAPPTNPPRRRYRQRMLAGMGILLAVGVSLALAYRYIVLAEEHAYQEAVAATERLDPGWRYADIEAGRQNIPDECNSALAVIRAYRALGNASGIPGGQINLAADAALTAEQLSQMRECLATFPTARAEVRRLKVMPAGRFPIAFDPQHPTYDEDGLLFFPLNVAPLVQGDALVAMHDGDHPAVVELVHASFHLARSLGDQPGYMALLVREGILDIALNLLQRALLKSTWSAAELEEIQAVLQRELDEPVWYRAARGERAYAMEVLAALRDGRLPSYPVARPGWRRWVPAWADSVLEPNRSEYLRTSNELVVASQLTLEEQFSAALRIKQAHPADDQLIEMYFKGLQMHLVSRAGLRCALAAVATERDRLEYGGWPDSTALLVQHGFLEQVPLDPQDGQPLRYQHLADGVKFYAVGPNPALLRGHVAEGFRLWDPRVRPLLRP